MDTCDLLLDFVFREKKLEGTPPWQMKFSETETTCVSLVLCIWTVVPDHSLMELNIESVVGQGEGVPAGKHIGKGTWPR